MDTTLLNNFYTEKTTTFSEENNSNFTCTIELNPEHEIYKGHFEQVPIAPGVCLIQIIKELIMDKFKVDLILVEGRNIKFLALINPTEHKDFQIDFIVSPLDGIFDVNATYINGGKAFTKLKLTFSEQ